MVYLELMKEMDLPAERLHERLNRVVTALNEYEVEYAVIGGNAIGSWLSHAREGAGIQTRDVDILLRKGDLDQAEVALKTKGFIRRSRGLSTMFLDGVGSSAIDAVHVVYAGEKYREDYPTPSPDVSEVEELGGTKVLSIGALTRMKLNSFRSKDRGHLIELMKEGLLDYSMIEKLPGELKERFSEVLKEFVSTPHDWE